MSNTLSPLIPKLLAQGLVALREQSIMPRVVNRGYEALAGDKGSTVTIPISAAIEAQAVSPAATPPATADVAPGSVTLTLDQWYEAPFYLSDKDLLEVDRGVIPLQASEAVRSLANNVDRAILALYKQVYGYAGTAGTTPLATDVSEYLAARKVLTNQLAPMDPRFMIMGADMEANALGLRAFQDASFTGNLDGIIAGQINNKLGARWLVDQHIPTHTKGAATAGTIALDDSAARPLGTKTLHMDGFSVKPSVGDVFTIAGDSQTYTVTASTALAGTDSDVSFEPGLKVALPAVDGGEVVTFKATHVVNLLLHRDAFAFASRPFAGSDPMGLGQFMSAVDPVSGLTLRLEVTREHKRTRFAYDILYGVAAPRPELATRLAG